MNVTLSIVIVSWNVREKLSDCLRSIENNPPSVHNEVIVVDNASTDGSAEMIKKDFPGVVSIANKENLGFAAANNQGLESANGRYILFLNPDTIVHPLSLDTLVRFMEENKDIGACGPKLLNEDGTTQPSARRFPTFRGALYRHTVFRHLRLFRGQYKKWLMRDFDHNRQVDVDQLIGAALMVGRLVVDHVGAMDERFFMFYEEVDLCYRIKQAHWRVVFTPQVVITHLGGQSAKQVPVAKRIMVLTSLLAFFRKHRGKSATALFNCIFKPAVILRDICNIASGTLMYIVALTAANSSKRQKSAAKIKNSSTLLCKYTWRLIRI